MIFLDPDKPIITCVSESCNDCSVADALHCHFSPKANLKCKWGKWGSDQANQLIYL